MAYHQEQKQNTIMALFAIIVGALLLLSEGVDSYRADFIPTLPLAGSGSGSSVLGRQQQGSHMIQQGCVWSTNGRNVTTTTTTTVYPPFLQQRNNNPRGNSFSLDCQVRTVNVEFWSNYSYSREQLEGTSSLNVKCNDKLFFESVLDPAQSFFRLRNLHEISFHSCKIRKIPTRIWTSLGFLKRLSISSLNGEWSSSVGMDVENGAFEGLSNLEKLELSQNNIWAIQDKNVFCPLRSLLRLNMSMNRLSDLEELGFSSGSSTFIRSTVVNGGGGEDGLCMLPIQNLDLSYNAIRRLNPNAFNRLRKLSELRVQNNLIDEIEDSAFYGLNQLRLLNMSSNRLVALPPSIFKFNPTLREINLSNNSISALSPEVFGNLPNLLSLDLSRNTLTSQWVTGSIFQSLNRLIILRLSYNHLSYIDSKIFENLGFLQALHLASNKIENINPTAFQSLKNLHLLDLSNNRITLIDSRHFSNLFLLRQLYLDHNKIREMDDDSLKNCTNLQDLGLQDNQLTQVPVALNAGLSHLVTLDIGENRIESITNESFKGLTQLYGLRIVDNKLSELGWGFCSHLTKLRVLNVAQNRISTISPGAFSACPELRALRLDTNALEELPTTLAPQLPSLLWLNVSENRLRWADYHVLPQTIEWLDLSYNMLETIGGPVSDGGKDPVRYSLRVLDASHNKLTSLDYTTIPPTLETLRLNHNELKTVSPDTFSRATRLRRVELIGNKIENLPLSAIRFPSVPSGKPLPEFYLGGNKFLCDCSMEWLTRVNQLAVLRQHPRIVDLHDIVCRQPRQPNQLIPLVEARPKDFLCQYKSHCFALCSCCEFEFCDCEMSCPSNCTCYHDTPWSANIVQCSNLQFSEIPSRLPMDSTEIYLDGNIIPSLGSHIFIGKKNLRVLHLNGSQVEVIRNKTFNGLKSLEVLNLASNQLTELNGYEFDNLENLKELYLQNNRIFHIAKETFSGLHYLQVVRLDGNLLHDFPLWTLSGNSYLNSVMLSNNPWSCNCEFLIPFRAWVASKTAIVVDFSLAKCQPDGEIPTVGSNSTSTSDFYGDSSSSHQPQQLIINMCDHNKELNFNFNHNDNIPALLDSELLNSNHISAEKVASSNDMNVFMSNNNHHHQNNNNNYPSINSISAEGTVIAAEESGGELWTIFTSVLITLIIVLVIIMFLVFRKDYSVNVLPFWLYSWFTMNTSSGGGCCGGDEDEDDNEGHHHHHHNHPKSFLSSILSCCCCGVGSGGHHGKKSGSGAGGPGGRMADSDKLFDAYFLYSRKDEDLLLQKIAPELESPYSTSSVVGGSHLPPPPPPHHGGNSCHYRLCLHYRDLPLSVENPLNTDMILSACDFSSRIVLLYSYSFVENELSHAGFRSTVQAVINRYKSKVVFILVPPFNEQNLLKIYPELNTGHFSTMSIIKRGAVADSSANSNTNVGGHNSQILSLEWGDKNFWSKLKLILPTPTLLSSASSPSGLNSTSTISSTGSSAMFNMAVHPHNPHNLITYNNSLSLHDYAYNTINSQHHQYHRNILPFQQLNSANTPPVPKHHIALTTSVPSWQQQQQQLHHQNFYNNSQHSQIIPIPGYPAPNLPPPAPGTLMVPNAFHQSNISFNESFRRHLQLQQNQNKMMTMPHPGSIGGGGANGPPLTNHQHHHSNCSNNNGSQGHHLHHTLHPNHHHQHQGSHCSSNHSSSTSNNNPSIHPYQPLDANYSSASSNEELLDHVYSTLDSPPIIQTNGSSTKMDKQINSNCIGETGKGNNEISPPQQNRLNNNNCPGTNTNSPPQQPTTTTTPSSNPTNNPDPNNNGGTMYFV